MATADVEAEAAFTLASEYEYTFKNFNKAKKLYEKAVSLGHKQAQFNYALWFLEGTRPGTKKSLLRARELFEKASEQGMGIALLNLGAFYEEGKGGVHRDLPKAYKLYKRASNDSDSSNWPDNNRHKAFMKIASMALEGKGRSKDVAKALKYMQKAKELRRDSVPDDVSRLMKMLQLVDPGIQQENSDQCWRRFSNHVDGLAEKDKPNTYGKWEEVLRKFGYEIQAAVTADKSTKCDFPEFMELCGGAFTMMDDYEMKDEPIPVPHCSLCKVEETATLKMKKCGRCKEHYCSRKCQKQDWPDHKKICDLIAGQREL